MEKFHALRIEKVLPAFHIKEKFDCEKLTELLTVSGSLTNFEDTTLNIAINRYRRMGQGWNEEE